MGLEIAKVTNVFDVGTGEAVAFAAAMRSIGIQAEVGPFVVDEPDHFHGQGQLVGGGSANDLASSGVGGFGCCVGGGGNASGQQTDGQSTPEA